MGELFSCVVVRVSRFHGAKSGDGQRGFPRGVAVLSIPSVTHLVRHLMSDRRQLPIGQRV